MKENKVGSAGKAAILVVLILIYFVGILAF